VKKYLLDVVSTSEYSQSRNHETEKLPRELAAAHEERTWREKSHVNGEGFVIIPANQFKVAITEAARKLSLQIPGKGKKTYTSAFVSSVFVPKPIVLPIKKEELRGEKISCNSNGKPGTGSRVWRIFPVISEWSGKLEIHVLDDIITEDVLSEVLICAGSFVGVGRWRPSVGGYNGRFEINKISQIK
jgi:hypothetical protein